MTRATAGPTDWAGLMRLGLGRLGLAPETFWAMTPAELWAALEGAGILKRAAPALDRGGLARLMAAYPDTPTPETHPDGPRPI